MSLRSWIKEVIREVIKEEVKGCPLIISERAPTEEDTYIKGTIWLHGNDKWILNKINVTWEKFGEH